jgi:hypothetical protein
MTGSRVRALAGYLLLSVVYILAGRTGLALARCRQAATSD